MSLPRRLPSLFLAGILLAVTAGRIQAHAALVDAHPAPGERISGSPDEIRLFFSESLVSGSTFTIYDTDFRAVTGLSPQIDPENREQISSPVPEMDPGTYTVEWSVVTEDGGETSGTYSFSVRAPSRWTPWLVVLAGFAALFAGLILVRRGIR